MSAWRLGMVTAFGRGETLALALEKAGFDVHVIDLTAAFGKEWHRGAGPFPVALTEFLPAQKPLLNEARKLDRGLALWLREGPIELGGPMADFYTSRTPVRALKSGKGNGFEETWLTRFLEQWASPTHAESWQSATPHSAFPHSADLGLIPASHEARVMSFERFQTLEHSSVSAKELKDVLFDGSRVTDLELDTGVEKAEQWVWCLSGAETEFLGSRVATELFPRGAAKAEWRWLGFQGRSARGAWTAGFPEYVVAISDVHLPWAYANAMIMRWVEADLFHAWIKVPEASARLPERHAEWARDIEKHLSSRLSLAQWKIESQNWWLCPHSPVFGALDNTPGWKNFEWIAPETLPRLDLSARLEQEAECLGRLVKWKNEQMKKQGARSDHALHAP